MNDLFSSVGNSGSSGLLGLVDNIWVMLAVVVISAISGWVQNRNKEKEQAEPWGGEEEGQARSTRSGTGGTDPNQPLNWEEELKRLLEGRPPVDGTAGTPPPPPPPPIVRRVPAPPALPKPVTYDSEEARPSHEECSPWSEESLDSRPAPTKPLAVFEQSARVHERTQRFHETVAAHMHLASHHRPTPAATRPFSRQANADARAVVAQLRSPATARQAVLAALLLGPPKALEN